MQHAKRYESNDIEKYKKFLLICIVIIIISAIASTIAKYFLKYQDITEADATRFYFSSNALDTTAKQYNYYDWNGKSEYNIEFELYNYEDELRYSNFEIPYEVNIKADSEDVDIKCSIDGVVTKEGTLKSENSKEYNRVKLTITPRDGVEISKPIQISVDVKTDSMYEKILSGIFNLNINNNNPFDVNLKSENDYEKLIITTYSYKGNIKIKYNSTKLMLFTDNIEGITTTDDGVILNVKSNSNYQIEFIKLTTDSVELGTDIVIET